AVDNVLMFFVAAIIGVLVTAFLVNALKKDVSVVAAGGGTIPESELEAEGTDISEAASPKDADSTDEKIEMNQLTDILDKNLIRIELEADKQDAVIDEMIQMLDQSDVVVSGADFKKDILDRESEGTTGLGMNIAIPHAKSGAVKRTAVVYGRNTGGVDWNSVD